MGGGGLWKETERYREGERERKRGEEIDGGGGWRGGGMPKWLVWELGSR